MLNIRARIHARAHRRALDGHPQVGRQRTVALILIFTAMARVAVWTILCVLYLVGVAFAVTLFKSVAFVALLSVLALLLTDWGQMASSLAQLTAGDAHADAEQARRQLAVDLPGIEEDIAKLADLQPGKEARALAGQIRKRLGN